MDKSILKIVADDPNLFITLKGTLIEKFSLDRMDEMMDDQTLGQMVRARVVGLRLIEEAFKEIARYKTIPENQPKVNLAR